VSRKFWEFFLGPRFQFLFLGKSLNGGEDGDQKIMILSSFSGRKEFSLVVIYPALTFDAVRLVLVGRIVLSQKNPAPMPVISGSLFPSRSRPRIRPGSGADIRGF